MNSLNIIKVALVSADTSTAFDGTVNGKQFWSEGLGATLATLLGVVGICVVVFAVLRAIKKVADGKIGDAIKGILASTVLAAVLFNPGILNTAIKAAGSFVEAGLATVTNIGNSTDSTVPTEAPDDDMFDFDVD